MFGVKALHAISRYKNINTRMSHNNGSRTCRLAESSIRHQSWRLNRKAALGHGRFNHTMIIPAGMWFGDNS
jgi:hypothetical protein